MGCLSLHGAYFRAGQATALATRHVDPLVHCPVCWRVFLLKPNCIGSKKRKREVGGPTAEQLTQKTQDSRVWCGVPAVVCRRGVGWWGGVVVGRVGSGALCAVSCVCVCVCLGVWFSQKTQHY